MNTATKIHVSAKAATVGWTAAGVQICAGKSRVNWKAWEVNSLGQPTNTRNFGGKPELIAYLETVIDADATAARKWW
jgi:hypothetical protein